MIIRVVDIETTGMAPPQAEVIELGMQDVASMEDGAAARMRGPLLSWLFSPDRPCPPEVMAVHHILPEQLEGLPRFSTKLAEARMIADSGEAAQFYAAHNAEFEMQFLGLFSGSWICTYKCALRIWPDAPSHGNQALMYWLGGHNELDEDTRHPPHRAAPDAYVTAWILVRILRQISIQQALEWSAEPRLLPTCPIGKFRGRPWPEVESGFLSWMLRTPDMEADLKWNAQRELNRRRTAALSGD